MRTGRRIRTGREVDRGRASSRRRRRAGGVGARLGVVLGLVVAAHGLCGCSATSAVFRRSRPPAGPIEAPEIAAEIHAREYRVPLRTEKLADPSRAAADFWAIAAPLAERQGAHVEGKKAPLRTSRVELLVLDTADQRLRRQGLTLERRGREDVPGGAPTCEITLESRSPDIRLAHQAPLEAANGIPSTLRFKEEVVVDGARSGAPGRVFALESTLRKAWRASDLSVGDVVALFPGTAARLGDPGAVIAPVNGIRVEEVELELGAITFASGATVRSTMVVWRDRTTHEILAGECVFAEKIADYAQQPAAEMQAERAYFAALQAAARDWLSPATSAARAAAVYDRHGSG